MSGRSWVVEFNEMTMRDEFAMRALTACMEAGLVVPAGGTWQQALAEAAYSIADAMLAERETAR